METLLKCPLGLIVGLHLWGEVARSWKRGLDVWGRVVFGPLGSN